MDQSIYDKCLASGGSPKLAELLASREFPGVNTDDTYFTERGTRDPLDGIPAMHRETIRAKLKKAGISLSGKRYLSQLADQPIRVHEDIPIDLGALVETRGDIQKRCEEKGWSCAGNVTVKGREPEREPEALKGVAQSLVDEHVERHLEANPEAAPTPKERMDLQEKVRQRLEGDGYRE